MAGRPNKFSRIEVQMYANWWRGAFTRMRGRRASYEIGVGSAPFTIITKDRRESELWEKLLRARKPEAIRRICKQSPLWDEKAYVREIYQQAEEFVASRNPRVVKVRPPPGDRNLWEKLKRAKTIQQVRNACYKSTWWKYQTSRKGKGNTWMRKLTKNADQFIKAKEDKRYPRSNRPSSEDKRLRYLSHAMAKIACGISYRTAVDWLEKTHP